MAGFGVRGAGGGVSSGAGDDGGENLVTLDAVQDPGAKVVEAYTELGRARAALVLATARHDARRPDRAVTMAAVENASVNVTSAEQRCWNAEHDLRQAGTHLHLPQYEEASS